MAYTQRFAVLVFCIIAVFIEIDPLNLSPINSVKFTPHDYSGLVIPLNETQFKNFLSVDNGKSLFKGEIFGPESLAFDSNGEGPYTGLGDGRIVKLNSNTGEVHEFAITSPSRLETCTLAKPGPNLEMEQVCGRPLGLRFHPETGDLYVADAYFGLMRVGGNGGQAEVLVDSAEGLPFKFTNDLDFGENGDVYFTDSSYKYQRRRFFLEVLEGGNYGRLLKYNINSGKTEVLLRGLRFPNGVAVSKEKDFLLFTETSLMRIHKYWLKGPKAGQSEVVAQTPGWPDNIRLNPRGSYWVGIHAKRNFAFDFLSTKPLVRKWLLKYPVPLKFWYVALAGIPHGLAMEIDSDGNLLRVLRDDEGKVIRAVSEIEEREGELWFGSVIMSFVATCNLMTDLSPVGTD